jgi:putative transposase
LWLILVTLDERKLAQTVEYLREENRILRNKLPDRITVTPRERARLVKFGRPLGTAIAGVITIVSQRTFARWARARGRGGGRAARRAGRGRRRGSATWF